MRDVSIEAAGGLPGLPELLDVLRGRRLVALAGAGCSTESGIPDYRGPAGSLRTRAPMQYREFVGSADGRARYWARSAQGWGRVARARPNEAHQALARLEQDGVLAGVITQNVDGLHQAAGSRRVVELHGSLAHVRCLDCGRRSPRGALQDRMLAENRAWTERVDAAATTTAAPDGDAALPDDAIAGFRVPACVDCDGALKPDVVFFGETVPPDRVREAWALFDEAEALLVVGSSLTVFSGRRFVYRAQKNGVPVAIVNAGPTRADAIAAAKVEGRLGVVLPRVAALLGRAGEPARR